ncbi:hypothetical protein BC567DRAFT_92596 [Phyllosticta citribraziliensis]
MDGVLGFSTSVLPRVASLSKEAYKLFSSTLLLLNLECPRLPYTSSTKQPNTFQSRIPKPQPKAGRTIISLPFTPTKLRMAQIVHESLAPLVHARCLEQSHLLCRLCHDPPLQRKVAEAYPHIGGHGVCAVDAASLPSRVHEAVRVRIAPLQVPVGLLVLWQLEATSSPQVKGSRPRAEVELADEALRVLCAPHQKVSVWRSSPDNVDDAGRLVRHVAKVPKGGGARVKRLGPLPNAARAVLRVGEVDGLHRHLPIPGGVEVEEDAGLAGSAALDGLRVPAVEVSVVGAVEAEGFVDQGGELGGGVDGIAVGAEGLRALVCV